jgi:hypothetical protein
MNKLLSHSCSLPLPQPPLRSRRCRSRRTEQIVRAPKELTPADASEMLDAYALHRPKGPCSCAAASSPTSSHVSSCSADTPANQHQRNQLLRELRRLTNPLRGEGTRTPFANASRRSVNRRSRGRRLRKAYDTLDEIPTPANRARYRLFRRAWAAQARPAHAGPAGRRRAARQ